MWENPNSLKLLVVCSIVFLIATWVFFNRFQSEQWNQYEQQSRLMAQLVATQLQEAWPEDRQLQQEATLNQLKQQIGKTCESVLTPDDTDVLTLHVYGPQGELIHECRKPGVLSVETTKMADQSSAIRLRKPNGLGTELVGSVSLGLSGASVNQNIQLGKQWFALIFLASWLVALLAVLFNTYIWSKHLKQLSEGVQRLSSGEFGFQIDERSLWGELKTLALAFNDMSARLQAYEAQNIETLKLERNKLEAMVMSIADGVVVCEDSGVIVMVNEAASRMLGVKSPALLEGRNIKDYATTEGDKCFQTVMDAFREFRKKASQMSEEGRQKAGPFSRQVELPELTLKVLLSSIEEERLGFVMVMHDVTREAEVDKLKTNFISNVSHELRTPVTTIKSYVDTLYNHGTDLDSQTYNEFIETIHVETERLKKMVNDILDFSRLEEGGVNLEKQWQELSPVINLTVQSVKVLAQQKELTLTTSLESNLPKVLINSESIERVLRNLLSNAIKYTSQGGRIKVRAELDETGDHVEVTVQDNGIGIADEHLPFIFDRFYRVENKVHTIKGTGLGLHLVKVAIEDYHDGEVFVKSKLGEGAIFGFRLPVVKKEAVVS